MKMTKPITLLACIASLISASLLHAEENAVVKENHVNVRGQPSLVGEVITQLQKGEKVVVLGEVAVAKPKTNEPPKWAKIQMPRNTPVWVYAPFLTSNKTVRVTRLNLRAGPGENYSVVGRIAHGTALTEIRRTDNWMEVETPPTAYAFVAADLLEKDTGGTAPTTPAPVVPVPTPATAPAVTSSAPMPTNTPAPGRAFPPLPGQGTPVENSNLSPAPPSTVMVQPSPQPAAPPINVAPAVPQGAAVHQEPAVVPPLPKAAESPAVAAPVEPARNQGQAAVSPPVDRNGPTLITKPAEPLVPRVVRREGIVRSTTSIQAPTYYELLNVENHKTINYLHLTKSDVKLEDYCGRRIVVTGEEELDARWPKTPVLEVQTLELVP